MKGFSSSNFIIIAAIVAIIAVPLLLLFMIGLGFRKPPEGEGAGYKDQLSSGGTCAFDLTDPKAISADELKKYLQTTRAGKPLGGYPADSVPTIDEIANGSIEAGKEFNVNPTLIVAIFNAESNFARNPSADITRGAKNPGNVKIRDADQQKALQDHHIETDGEYQGHTKFKTWRDGFRGLALKLRTNYLDKGRTTIESIGDSDHKYDYRYVETNQRDEAEWVKTVKAMMAKILGGCAPQIPQDKGICPAQIGASSCVQKPLPLTNEMSSDYGIPKAIVLHYLAEKDKNSLLTVDQAWQYFKNISGDGQPDNNKYVQFVIARDGVIYQFLAETKKAAGAKGYNETQDGGISIHIENEGHFESGKPEWNYTNSQLENNVALIKYLMEKYKIPKDRVLSHKQAQAKAVELGRITSQQDKADPRSDPGETFMKAILAKL